MNTDDMTQSLEGVYWQERMAVYPLPLKIQDRIELFKQWLKANPEVWREMELTAVSIDSNGLRVSTQYLIEKQRYEGTYKLNGVPFLDGTGQEHCYGINNTDAAILARYLKSKYPDMDIIIKKSMFDDVEVDFEA